jgi:hypothetical protein
MPRFNSVQPSIFREEHRSSLPADRSNSADRLIPDSDFEEFVEDDVSGDDLLGDEELLVHSLVNSPRTPETEPSPTLTADAAEDLLLDESSLATVLEILTTIATVEELAILEALTAAQKRQVWSHTPETIKIKLKQIRQADAANNATQTASVEGWQTLDQADRNQPLLSVGDLVVLLAKPKLTSAELIAIWEVVEVHEASARIQSHIGTRNYPISWMMLYSKPISTSA